MASMEGFTEGAILSLLFISLLTIAIGSMNLAYDKNIDVGLNDDSGTEQKFIEYMDTSQTEVQGGEAAFDAQQGITVKSSWGLAKDASSIIWSFFSGGFIEKLATAWHLGVAGTIFAKVFRMLYVLAMIYAMLYVLFKVIL